MGGDVPARFSPGGTSRRVKSLVCDACLDEILSAHDRGITILRRSIEVPGGREQRGQREKPEIGKPW